MGEKIRFLGFPIEPAAEKGGGHGRPLVAAGELVGSSARARKARGRDLGEVGDGVGVLTVKAHN
jgi:hypothetical protein